MRVVGVDLGGTKIQTVVADVSALAAAPLNDVVDPGMLIEASARRLTPAEGGLTAIRDAVADSVAAVGLDDVVAVGVGVPGPVDPVRRVVLRAPNLAGFGEDVPVGGLLSGVLGVEVAVDNDVNVAVLAEHRLGAGRGISDMLGVWCGTGIGGGLVLGGQLRRGPHGLAAEFGHMVIAMGGRKNSDGIRGSIEAYAGRAAMERRARKEAAKGRHTILDRIARAKGKASFTSGVFHKAVSEGDELAIELIGDAVAALGAGVASAVNLVDLERIVLGGGVADSFGEALADEVAQAMRPHLIAPEYAPEVVTDELGDFAGALGAAVLAAETANAASRRPV